MTMSSFLQELKSVANDFFDELLDDKRDAQVLQSLYDCLRRSNVSWEIKPSLREECSQSNPKEIRLVAKADRDKYQPSIRIELVRELLDGLINPPLLNYQVIISSEAEILLPLLQITFVGRQSPESRTPKMELFNRMFQMGTNKIKSHE